jgi:Tfp pilus assembly protein PilF
VSTPWACPRFFAESCLELVRIRMLLLLFLLAAVATAEQENLPPSVEIRLAAGVEALKSGDLDTADKVFSEALQQGVRHPLVFHNLGVIAQERGEHKQAVLRFRQALQLQTGYGPSRLLLGISLLALGKKAEAVRELERAVRLMPNETQAHLQLAKAYETSDNWIAAVRELQKVVELAPQEPEYSYQLGRAWAKLSGWAFEQITRLNPDSARLQQALGQEYAIQEKYDAALAAYQRAARSDPKLPEIHLAAAVILLELKRFDEALVEIDLEHKLVPVSKAAAEIRAKIEAAKASLSP